MLRLEPAASRHVASALRLQAGDSLTLFNGSGGEYRATINAVERKQVRVTVAEFNGREAESPLHIHLGIAISRGERMDWLIQKCTELGVTSISPLFSERCEVKLKAERSEKKLRHWQQVAISACEQCGRNRTPAIAAPQPLHCWSETVAAEQKMVLHHRAAKRQLQATAPASLALLTGPEGGLTEAEITTARQHGFTAVALGPRVMRTETAPLAACAILQARWGDMD
jgi:16S rRNA (uracil1498-N3)-methyltransferase